MTDPKQPRIDFYHQNFQLDMNSKKQIEWEAIVKIPFIEEGRFLTVIQTKENLLSPGEHSRNDFGVNLKFSYNPNIDAMSLLTPGVFPEISRCHCVANVFELPSLEELEIIVGLCEGAKFAIHALAVFLILKTLLRRVELGYHGVNDFQQDSRNGDMEYSGWRGPIREGGGWRKQRANLAECFHW